MFRIDTLDDIIAMTGPNAFGVDLAAEIRKAEEFCKSCWGRVEDPVFTVHDARHSMEILRHLAAMKPAYGWSQYEWAVLAVAAFIHDVGMQYNAWATAPCADGREIWQHLGQSTKAMAPEVVRENHVDLGERLIRCEVSGKRVWPWPLAVCSGGGKSRQLLDRAADVGFAHSTELVWSLFRDRPSPRYQKQQLAMSGGDYRPCLLAGMFRLADELDGTSERVPNIDLLWSSGLPSKSKAHWLANHFVSFCSVECRDLSLSVRLNWNYPRGASDVLIERVRKHVLKYRVDTIDERYRDIRQVLLDERDAHPIGRCDVGLSEQGIDDPILECQRVEDYFAVLDGGIVVQGTERARSSEERIERQSSFSTSAVPDAADETTPLVDRLRHWFDGAKRPMHVELATHEHTDTFVHCRSLVANKHMLRMIAEAIAALYVDEKPTDVVAVGTTAIPIAVRVGVALSCNVSFMFYKHGGGDDADVRHSAFEVDPSIGAGGTRIVLTIDDIIAGGVTAMEVDARIRQVCGMRNNDLRIMHCAVFRLGVQELPKELDAKYLCHIKEVYYAECRDACELCERGQYCVHEWDV